jgi:hypothetical protein
MEPLEGIAAADEHLGRPMPLPSVPLPLARWVEVRAVGPEAVEVEWNLDDTRAGAPGRLALYAGAAPPEERGALRPAEPVGQYTHRSAPLDEASPSLKPVHELSWEAAGLHLRLTAQGPWALDALREIAASVAGPG